MLYNLLRLDEARCFMLEELLDKTTVQGRSAAWGRSAGFTLVQVSRGVMREWVLSSLAPPWDKKFLREMVSRVLQEISCKTSCKACKTRSCETMQWYFTGESYKTSTSPPYTGALFGALWSSLDFGATPNSGVHTYLYTYVQSQISSENGVACKIRWVFSCPKVQIRT